MKKALSLLLAVVMAVGLLPMTALAANGPWTDQTVKGNTYIDTTADPNKSYEYTVTGSDGSKQTVVVPAANAEPTGNEITEQAGIGAVYYQKIDARDAQNGTYLLVYNYRGTDYAVSNDRNGDGWNGYYIVSDVVTVQEDSIAGPESSLEYNLVRTENQMQFKHGDRYLGVNDGEETDFTNENQAVTASATSRNVTLASGKWKIIGRDGQLDASQSWLDQATAFTLYQKMTDSANKTWTVGTAGLDKLLNQSFVESQYTEDSWKTYADAKAQAEAAKKELNNPYTEKTAADAALIKIDNATRSLDAAIQGLTKKPAVAPIEGEVRTPEITWQRTLEGKVDSAVGQGKLVTGIEFNTRDYTQIKWNWDEIKDLTTDPSMTVWDYNTRDQYSAQPGDMQVKSAATWNEWEKTHREDSWNDASVRKFTGTFAWPEGYTLDDRAAITSVNDENYAPIYNEVKKNETLNSIYGTSKVIPVNDDMYVYVYKQGEDPSAWTAEEAAKHLVFWTGSSGKGMWSDIRNTGADWDRTEPPIYGTKAAVPAFHGVWPNNVAVTNRKNEVKAIDQLVHMEHTDGWYTLVGTDTLTSTLKSLYPKGIQGGEQICIDVYAFDNNGIGGMDELKIDFVKAKQTETTVTVEYYVDIVSPGTKVGTTTMNNVPLEKDGKPNQITLLAGTTVNKLNHMKAAAKNQAHALVKDGVQQDPVPLTVQKDATKNVIQVLYELVPSAQTTQYYTYDFGVENRYEFYANGEQITSAKLKTDEPAAAELKAGESRAAANLEVTVENGKAVLTYTPDDANGEVVYATLVVSYGEAHDIEFPIRFIPASNVLYEENMMHTESADSAQWTMSGHNTAAVADNRTTVYGWTASNETNTGANGVWHADVTAEGSTRFTDFLNFEFIGKDLDIIGTCGPDTGSLLISISLPNGERVQNFMVNTMFSKGTIHQVPLIHAVLPKGGAYEVSIRGANIVSNNPQTAAMSANAPMGGLDLEAAYELMYSMGLTDEDIENVQFIGMEDVLSQNAMTFSAEPAKAATDATAGQMFVEIDGFRVYRSSRNASAAYPETETDKIYTNIIDATIEDAFAAFVENVAEGNYQIGDYEKKGGPENEVYLGKNQSIAFKVNSSEPIQVSLRNVYDNLGASAQINGAEVIAPNHNTEMYYAVQANDLGLVTIKNTGSGLLAIGNIKHSDALARMTAEDHAVVLSMVADPVEPEPQPEPSPEFLVFFELDKWGYGWQDGSPRHQAKQFTVTEQDGITAPAMNPGEGYRLVCWKAVDQDLTLDESELLTVQAMEDCADWTGKERIVIFRPVVEEIEAEEKFEPEHFDIRLSVERGYTAKYVNVNVEASEEVAYITVNGRRIDANNADWVEFGFDPYLIFVTDLELGRNDEVAIEIVAYDESGNASEVFLARE